MYSNEKLVPEGDGRLWSLVIPCGTTEGMQKKTLYCHRETPNVSDIPPTEGLNCKKKFFLLIEGKVQLKSGT